MKRSAILFLLMILPVACDAGKGGDALRIPLKEGRENPAVRFGTLNIEPVRLYIQSKPYDDRSVRAELELNLTEGDVRHNTSFAYRGADRPEDFLPEAFESYAISWSVDDGDGTETSVCLIVEKNAFGKEFIMTPSQTAVIGGLSVRFDGITHETASFEPDGPMISGEVYDFTLSDGGEQEQISLTSYAINEAEQLLFEWKEYKIRFAYAGDRLKLKIDME